jgi:hypothetical protein
MALAALEILAQLQTYRLVAGFQGKSLKRTMGCPIATPHVPALSTARAAKTSSGSAPAVVRAATLEGSTQLTNDHAIYGNEAQWAAAHNGHFSATNVRDLFGVTSSVEVQVSRSYLIRGVLTFSCGILDFQGVVPDVFVPNSTIKL